MTDQQPQQAQQQTITAPNAPQQPQQVQQVPQQPQQVPQQAQVQTVDMSGNVVDNPYQSIVEQQNAQIQALIEQNNALNQQVVNMLQNGAQINQQQPQQPQQFAQAVPQPQQVQFPNIYQPADTGAHPLAFFNPPALADDQDFSLESLASEIGKKVIEQ